jgi:hypothetical protein
MKLEINGVTIPFGLPNPVEVEYYIDGCAMLWRGNNMRRIGKDGMYYIQSVQLLMEPSSVEILVKRGSIRSTQNRVYDANFICRYDGELMQYDDIEKAMVLLAVVLRIMGWDVNTEEVDPQILVAGIALYSELISKQMSPWRRTMGVNMENLTDNPFETTIKKVASKY